MATAPRDKSIRDITEKDKLERIIQKAEVCYMGMVDNDLPYVLGFCFGFEDGVIYLHCAKEGKKIDVLAKNNNVCLLFDVDHDLFARHEQVACSWRLRYRSALAYGKAIFVEDYDEKVKGLNVMMKHYSDKEFEYSKPAVNNISVIKIVVDKITGRSFEY